MRAALLVVLWLSTVFVGVGASEQESRPPAERGARLFLAEGCHGCHTVGAFGTPIGPDLSRVGLAYSEAELAAWVRDPAVQRPTARMPKLEIAPADADAIAAYLASLRGRAS